MKPSLIARLDQLANRLEELDRRLADPRVIQDLGAYRQLSREHGELTQLVERYRAWRQAGEDLSAAEALLEDPEMRELAVEERALALARQQRLEGELLRLMLPRDPNDERNLFLEIRAGTGGNEAALFAGDLLRMYTRYAERRGWRVEILSANPGEVGGYKEVICRISGPGAYSRLKYESGGHRVQRVPATESQGRIHTSACTVAVMPEADEVGEVVLDPAELKIDTFRASGAGGQHVNRTDSAVRVTHLPTGLVVECQDDRSQHRNKATALAILAARLKDLREREARAREASTRRSLVGSGDRSDRIRTYNFPQGRVTDHRINLTLYRLEAVLDGDLDEILDALTAEDQAEQLAALAGEG